MTIEKCNFGVRQVEFLGRIILSEESHRKLGKIKISLIYLDFPNQKKHYKQYQRKQYQYSQRQKIEICLSTL